ncbi:pantoate--beta-alanine ligase [Maribacter algarum]|uniref:Pantothenate synthetase n=1 Tax=Maribacter algarum (ex Zhang et al. 2020) TaxID=2578118 RepID=A0A5S3PYB7_9FLAO|nr:pantoate--beta-alanine ligase [Maribacter algarum]TMM59272.1 pantoate--beta-alanine ligase [Maribacter algarum]
MVLVRTKKELASLLSSFRKTKGLGLVPTMGALHQGHMTLVKEAISQNENVIVSIFVNPTQFNNKEDLEKYPQTLQADIALLKEVSDKICVFAPNVEEIYADKVKTKVYDFEGLDKVMEGEFRDDHFNGVGTIVEALLILVKPDKAYFGEKDFQQLQIIKKLVAVENIDVEIIGCPIVREPSGLAMSSRNERLSSKMRKEASFIYKTLTTAKNKFGIESAKDVLEWVESEFLKHPDLDLEYIAITDVDTLTPIQKKQKNRKYRAFVAVYTEDIRLIDNIALN